MHRTVYGRKFKRTGAESAEQVLLKELCVLYGSAFQTPAKAEPRTKLVEEPLCVSYEGY